MSRIDDVKTLSATLVTFALFLVMARFMGKLFWESITTAINRRMELLRRLRHKD